MVGVRPYDWYRRQEEKQKSEMRISKFETKFEMRNSNGELPAISIFVLEFCFELDIRISNFTITAWLRCSASPRSR